MLHSLNQKNVPTSLCVARIKWCEKAKGKFSHLEGWGGPKAQTFRFMLCLLVETVLLCVTQWQHNSFCQGLSEAQPWGLLKTSPLLARVWNFPWIRLHCWAVFMGLSLSCVRLGCCLLPSFHTPLWRAYAFCIPSDQCHADGREWRSYWMPLKPSFLWPEPALVL